MQYAVILNPTLKHNFLGNRYKTEMKCNVSNSVCNHSIIAAVLSTYLNNQAAIEILILKENTYLPQQCRNRGEKRRRKKIVS